jgi:hypothetical protein
VRLLGIGLLSICIACAPRNPAIAVSDGAGESRVEAPVVTLERTACFGGCPVYRVSVAADGTVTFEGRAHVRQLGAASGRIPPAREEALISELEREGYYSCAPPPSRLAVATPPIRRPPSPRYGRKAEPSGSSTTMAVARHLEG